MDPDFKAQLVVKGLTRPTGMIFLDDDDILVTEKQGVVKRINGNEILQSPVLDIRQIVNDTGERGLLSIAIFHPEDEEKNQKDENNRMIYVLFTNERGKNSTNNFSCLPESCRNLQNVFNSLYRYDFKDGVMVNPKLLANIPLYSNESIQHIGGAFIVGPDEKLYFTGGDGRGCEYSEDCVSKTSYFTGNNETKSTGGIYFLTDSHRVASNETSLPEYYQYAYGVRNSFGLDFDPVTGNLWDTENGPAFGDEINLVKPGLNSGWPKFQGIWSVTNYSQLFNNPPPGLPKGYYFTQVPQNPADFKGSGNYSTPEFTWNQTVGVTTVKFFDSNKYGSNFKNDIFIATFNGGLIYHFDLNGQRNQLLLKGPLTDKVANNDAEMNNTIFAQDFGPIGISDLEVGPDGYLYVLTYGQNSAIYRIVPN
jgi:glucose/arabinose dehydrogenase